MSYYGSEEHEPVTWVRGHAIYAAHFVVLVFVASLLVTSVLMFAQAYGVLTFVHFDSAAVLRGQIWRIFTYGFWNSPAPPQQGFNFAVDMLMMIWFGREVEKVFGRVKFLVLFGCIYLLPSLLFTAFGRWLPATFAGEFGAFAIFIAFSTLYPNASIFFALLAKWVAVVLFGIYTLAAMADHDWVLLVRIWSTSAFAFAFTRYQQGHFTLPSLRLPRRKPKLRVLPDLPERSTASTSPASVPSASMAEVDALLDKIAQSGIGSLTAKERAKLDAARRDLKKRSGA